MKKHKEEDSKKVTQENDVIPHVGEFLPVTSCFASERLKSYVSCFPALQCTYVHID